MKELLDENTKAHDQYLFAVGPLYQWCGSVKNKLPRTVRVIQEQDLSDSDRSYMKRKTENLLHKGVEKAGDSIRHI